jgi:hypothetical protein
VRHQLADHAAQAVGQVLGRRQPACRRLALEPPDDLRSGGHAAVGQDQGVLDLLPDVLVGRVEGDGLDLLRHRATALRQVLPQAPEQAAAASGLLRGGRGDALEPDEHALVVDGRRAHGRSMAGDGAATHGDARAAGRLPVTPARAGRAVPRRPCGRRRDSTFDTPSPAIVTP